MEKNFCVGSNKFLTLDKYSTSPILDLLLGKIFGVEFYKEKSEKIFFFSQASSLPLPDSFTFTCLWRGWFCRMGS